MNADRPGSRGRRRDAGLILAAMALLAGGVYAVVPSGSGHGAGGAGGKGTTAKANTAKAGAPALTVRYRTDTPAMSPVAKPWLEVVNSGKKNVALTAVRVRYYFTGGVGTSYSANCVQAAFGCSNLAVKVAALPTPGQHADHYVEVSFAAGAGSLAPGQNSKGLQLQFFRADHEARDQSSDRSFDASATTYKASTTITAYLAGALAWGEEPPGSTPGSTVLAAGAKGGTGTPGTTASAGGSGSTSPTVPAGVVFDTFQYSGPDDPALKNHGWNIRTSSGGPGIKDTWSPDGVSFPADPDAAGGQVMQLRATTDGTKAGTKQAEIESSDMRFVDGTFAARVHFPSGPTSGKAGDAINQAFFAIAPESGANYAELDDEYMANGWGSLKGPIFDTTSWRDPATKDRVTSRHKMDLSGWHTLVINVKSGTVTFLVDGKKLFTSSGKYYPHVPMVANFNAWFGGLYATGQRTWDMKVNWFYYNTNGTMSASAVNSAVRNLYAQGSTYLDTVHAF